MTTVYRQGLPGSPQRSNRLCPGIFPVYIFYLPVAFSSRLCWINLIFRCIPFHFVRLIAESLNIFLNVSSDIASHSRVDRLSTSLMGMNAISSVGLLKRFHGQTYMQISQPKAQSSNLPFTASGIVISFNSMVK